ncbi:MAG: glutathione peroxidase [Flavobacteriales bacterium]
MKFITLLAVSLTLFSCTSNENTDNSTQNNNSINTEKTMNSTSNTTLYSYEYNSPSGETKSMKDYEGNVILAVNTATQCGLTPQFEGLEELHNTFGDKGLKVIGFPCNQFGGQEPLSNEEMVETCKINHGVTFELTQKIDVNGENAHPIYSFLKNEQPIEEDNNIRWNFEKFLIDKNGKVVKRFSPQTTPEELTSEIEKLL